MAWSHQKGLHRKWNVCSGHDAEGKSCSESVKHLIMSAALPYLVIMTVFFKLFHWIIIKWMFWICFATLKIDKQLAILLLHFCWSGYSSPLCCRQFWIGVTLSKTHRSVILKYACSRQQQLPVLRKVWHFRKHTSSWKMLLLIREILLSHLYTNREAAVAEVLRSFH